MTKSKLYEFYNNKKALAAVLIHLMVLFMGYSLLNYFDFINTIPNNNNVVNWDAYWFSSIKDTGYKFLPSRTCNLAFFPLFPVVWSISSLDALSICLLNASVFFIAFILLLDNKKSLFFYLFVLSLPSFIFFALPYSESLFFLLATIILIGYNNNSTIIKSIGFFAASLTKSVSLIFIPAIICCEFFNNNSLKRKVQAGLTSILYCVLGLFFVVIFQWIKTGKWFYFFDVQKFWRRSWLIPKFPLTTYRPEKVLGFDAVSFILGITAIFYIVKWLYLAFFSGKGAVEKKPSTITAATVFSALIIAATVVLDTFFTFNHDGSTSIWSINRHILCTPFGIIFLAWLYQYGFQSRQDAMSLVFILTVGVYFTGVYKYNLMFVYYFLFFISLVILRIVPSYRYWLVIIYIGSTILQILTFHDFLNGKWVG